MSRRPSGANSYRISTSTSTTPTPPKSKRSRSVSNAGDTGSILTQTTTAGSTSGATIRGDGAGGPPQERRPLHCTEQNPFAPETVVLLHILFSCGHEWKEVLPKLPSYHLLVPDLPCHSGSRDVCRREDFSFEVCADYVADLIRTRAHDGRAHIVGISSGGFVALELIRKYPALVAGRSAFVAGAWPYTGSRRAIAQHPRLTYSALWSVLRSPGYVFFKASGLGGEYQNDELLDEIKRNGSSRLARAASMLNWDEARMREVARAEVRLCLVAGGKGFDAVGEARLACGYVRSERQGGELEGFESGAFLVRDAIHAWNLQFPLLFAKGIQSWFERRPLPAEYENLL